MREVVMRCWVVVAASALLFAVACQTNPPTVATPTAEPAASLGRVTLEQDAAPLGVGRVYTLPAFVSIDGVQADGASLMRGKSVVVVAMTSGGCPVSQKYGPRVAGMEREYAGRGVGFVHVNTVAAESDGEIREQIREVGFRGTYAPDRDRALARVLKPRTTAEVYVFDPTWTLRYRGAVDDQFGVGVALPAPRRNFLRDAIEAVLKKETPAVVATWAPGCLVDAPDSAGDVLAAGASPVKPNPPPRGITYYNRVAHILDRHCLDCHRTNGPGPFNLASASSIDGRAAMIAAVVRDGLMPPSHGEERSHDAGHWRTPIAMPAQDRADLIAWLSSDRPLGNPGDAPKAMAREQGWVLGTPDQFLMTETMRLTAEGPMMHQRLAIPTTMTEDLWLRAIEMKPMKQGTIERAVAWVVPAGAAPPRGGEDISSVAGVELIGAYSPGHGFVRYAEGTARRFRAGSTVVVDVYARPMGKVMGVAMRIGLYVRRRDEAIKQEVRSKMLFARPFEIAAGDGAAVLRASEWMVEETRVVAMTPSMGARGKRLRVFAEAGSGPMVDLLRLDRFDSRWSIRYETAKEVGIPGRATLNLEGVFDNSEANASNPTPGVAAKSGAGTTQESLWVGVEYLVEVGGGAK